jgi:hypothetical protein
LAGRGAVVAIQTTMSEFDLGDIDIPVGAAEPVFWPRFAQP